MTPDDARVPGVDIGLRLPSHFSMHLNPALQARANADPQSLWELPGTSPALQARADTVVVLRLDLGHPQLLFHLPIQCPAHTIKAHQYL